MSLLIDHAPQAKTSKPKKAKPLTLLADRRVLVAEERERLKGHREKQAHELREMVGKYILRRARGNPHLQPQDLVKAARQRFGGFGQGVVTDSMVVYLLKQAGHIITTAQK